MQAYKQKYKLTKYAKVNPSSKRFSQKKQKNIR